MLKSVNLVVQLINTHIQIIHKILVEINGSPSAIDAINYDKNYK
jgi:hypothetical protein